MSGDEAGMLRVEIDQVQRICDLLERQREALLTRDLPNIEQTTRALEAEFGRLAAMVRSRAMSPRPEPSPASAMRLLTQEARAARSRLVMLLDVNQAIIGDRLAHMNALLGQVMPGESGGGYEPLAADRRSGKGVLIRTA